MPVGLTENEQEVGGLPPASRPVLPEEAAVSTIVPIELVSAGGRSMSADQVEITMNEITLLRQGMMGTTRIESRPRPTLRQWEPGDVERMFTLEWLPAPARAALRRTARPDDHYLAMRFGDSAGSETWLFRGDRAGVDAADAALQGKVMPVVLPDSAEGSSRDIRPAPLLVLAGVLAVLGILSLLASRGDNGAPGTASATVDAVSPLSDGQLARITADLTRELGYRPTFSRIEVTRNTVHYDLQRPGTLDFERRSWTGGSFTEPTVLSVRAPARLRERVFLESEVRLNAVSGLVAQLQDLKPQSEIEGAIIGRPTTGGSGVRIHVRSSEGGTVHHIRANARGDVLSVGQTP